MAAKLLSLLLSCGVVAVAGGGLPCTVFSDAIFSPDGQWIYYVKSDMSGSYRYATSSDGVPNSGIAKERIDRETITIHRKHLESGRDELVRAIPAPPWLGLTYMATDCGEYRYASLTFNEASEVRLEFFGPSLRPNADWQDAVIAEELLVYRDGDAAWTKTPFKSIYRRPAGNWKWKNLELVRYDDEWWWLLDHETRTFKVVLAGSKPVMKNASNFTYDKIMTLTQPRAQAN